MYPVSHSQIETYVQCPLKFHYKYRARLKGKKSTEAAPALENGIKVHKMVESYLKHGDVGPGRWSKDQKTMFDHWFDVCWPTLEGKLVASELHLIGYYKDTPLNGYLDMLYFEGTTAYIVDLKTGNNLFFLAKKMYFSRQPDIYGLLVRANYPEVEDIVWIQHNVAVEGAEISQRPVYLDEARLKVLDYWLAQMVKDPAVPNEGWECSRCPFEDTCEGRLRMGTSERFNFEITEEDEEDANVGEA